MVPKYFVLVNVVSITDEDVFPKIDVQYVKSKLSHVDMSAAIIFICTNENWRKEDAWKHKGETYDTIRLPYQQVKEMEDVRLMMVELGTKKGQMGHERQNKPLCSPASLFLFNFLVDQALQIVKSFHIHFPFPEILFFLIRTQMRQGECP